MRVYAVTLLIPLVVADDDLLAAGGKVVKVRPPKVTKVAPPHKEHPVARAYNISEPIYSCPKPGYTLHGEDCIFEDSVPARFECPVGFTPQGGTPGNPQTCVRKTPPTLSCPQGKLVGNTCQITQFSEPVTNCPPGTTMETDGSCVRYDPVTPVDRCPEGSQMIHGGCAELTFTEPQFVCPHDTIAEGKKCRREVVTYKMKKRQLSAIEESDAAAAADEPADYRDDTRPGVQFARALKSQYESFDDSDFEMFADLPDHVFQNDDYEPRHSAPPPPPPCGGSVPCHSSSQQTKKPWIPAPNMPVPTKPPKFILTEAMRWQKVHVQVPVMVQQRNTPPPPQPKPPKVKVKVEKVKPAPEPQQVIKVQYIPAEKVCPMGEKHGGQCVVKTPVSPVSECPVPLIHGNCVRRIVVPPTRTCPTGELVCMHGGHCRCETVTEQTPVSQCMQGTLDPATNLCISTCPPRPYCPLGYFLDPVTNVCTKRDVEPALCLFTVTYICPDCDY